MKLSLKKRLGWVQVRGGAIRKVAKSHAVSTRTLSYEKKGGAAAGARPPLDEKWVWTNVDDIAIEIKVVKTGKVIGLSYLSGAAIQMHRYVADAAYAESHYRDGVFVCLKPPFRDDVVPLSTVHRTVIEGVKFGAVDGAWVYTAGCESEEEADHVTEFFAHIYRHYPVGVPPEDARGHLFVLAHTGEPRRSAAHRSAGKLHTMHCQPHRHESEFSIAGFQWGLLESAVLAGEATSLEPT